MSEKRKGRRSGADGTAQGNIMKSADTDPNGSYTGICEDPYEKPVQDADDL